jgi:hypothetical protein
MLGRVGVVDGRSLGSPEPFDLFGRQVRVTYWSVISAIWSASAKRRPSLVMRTMPSKTSSSRTCNTCSTVPSFPRLAASPDDRLGHDLAAVQNGVGQLPVDLADGGDRAELVEPG